MRSRANSACGARGPTRTPPARTECGRAVHRLATAVPTCQAGVMCARYGIFSATAAVAEAFAARLAPEAMRLKPSGTLAPGADVAVVVRRPESADGSGTGGPAPSGRRVHAARWGLLPPGARDPAAAFHAFNARCETAAVKPTFRDAMRSFRVVVPASCWYEWRAQTPSAAQAGGSAKQPYAVRRADGGGDGLLALAGLCSWWRVPGRPGNAPVHHGPALHDSWLLTCTILTRDAGPDLAWLHPREPVVLPDDAVGAWLDPDECDGGAAAGLLRLPRPALAWMAVDRSTLTRVA